MQNRTWRFESAKTVALLVVLAIAAAQLGLDISTYGHGISTEYEVDNSQSEITVTLIQEGFMRTLRPKHHVGVKSFSGKINLPPEDELKVSVRFKAQSRSFENIDKDMSEFERREFHKILHDTVLESEKFPEIEFNSISMSNLKRSGEERQFIMNGNLKLRDVTRKVSVPVRVHISKDELRATGESSLRQTEFGITPYSGGLGTIKIGDEVTVSFRIVAKGI